jgi:hypothetical protein
MHLPNSRSFWKRTFVSIFLVIFLFSAANVYASVNPVPAGLHEGLRLARGLEVRYIVIKDAKEKEKTEIEVAGKKYALYKTKEDAVRAITVATPKHDLVVVYVISDTEKEKELIELTD